MLVYRTWLVRIMQLLVVMAAVLGLMGVESQCSECECKCDVRAKQMVVEACGQLRIINTSECAGRCYLKHDVYRMSKEAQRQKVCRGEWLEKTARFADCPGGSVTYAEAVRCTCSTCHPASTDCDKHLAADDLQHCLP